MKKMIIAVCILTFSVFSASASGGSERLESVSRKNTPKEFTPPPIDLAAPAAVETATFGLG